MAKRGNGWKGLLQHQSEFSHLFACWALNHQGWAKMKAYNRRLAKRRLRQRDRRQMARGVGLDDCD